MHAVRRGFISGISRYLESLGDQIIRKSESGLGIPDREYKKIAGKFLYV